MAFHCAIVPLNLMFVRLVHLEKTYLPMLVTLPPIVTRVSPVQPSKAEMPMLVTLFGSVMFVSPVQP